MNGRLRLLNTYLCWLSRVDQASKFREKTVHLSQTPFGMNRLFFGILLVLAGCGPASKKNEKPETGTLAPDFKLPYRLTAPDENYKMPGTLNEISGLTYYKDDKLLCV